MHFASVPFYDRMADDSYGGFALAIHQQTEPCHCNVPQYYWFDSNGGLLSETALPDYMIKGGATYRIIYDNLWIHAELTSRPKEQILLQKPSCKQLPSS